MPDRLPVRVNPYKMAESGKTLKGTLTEARMVRLKDILVESGLVIDCVLAFSKQGRNMMLSGVITAHIVITCQRCMQAMDYDLNSQFALVLVESDEQAERLQKEYEPYCIAEDELMDLSSVVEDEILLSIPSHPKHEHECITKTEFGDRAIETKQTEKENNPFSVLEKLK